MREHGRVGPGIGLIVLIAIGGAALARAWAERRVRRGDRRMVPLLLLSTLLVALLLLGAAAWFAFRQPLVGVPLTIGALVLGGAWLRVSLDTARYAGPARPTPDRMDALADSLAATYRSLAAGLLGIGFVAAIIAVLWLFGRGRF